MISASLALAIGTAAIAVTNWSSRLPGSSAPAWVQWFSKPAVTAGLAIGASRVDAADPIQQRLFVIGLILCLVGDVALMLPVELFRSGLVAFLLGHLAFVAGFASRFGSTSLVTVAISATVLTGCLAMGLRHLLPAVRRLEPKLFGPVLGYILVIAFMTVASWWGGHAAAPLGAASFAVSDLILADNKFVAARRWSPLAVMVTYHLALALLVWSLR